MIAAITGELKTVAETSITLDVPPMIYELLISAADSEKLQESIGQTLTFSTLLYLEGDPNRGNLEPRLIGFITPRDKQFFELFTTVNGIGPKKALKALNVPIADVARAIESGNTKGLTALPQIGKRLAEQIIATLAGKCAAYTDGIVEKRSPTARRNNEDETAIALMTSPQMGLRRPEAEELLERTKSAFPDLKTADELVPEMLKLHASR